MQFVRVRKHVKRKLMQGAELFNHDRQKGLRFLQSCQLLPAPLDAGDVAAFIRFVPGLSKQVVGEYLGGHDAFNIEVLYCFVELFDFEGMPLDAALRAFLDAFRLPGEAQKISRILEAFASRYHRQCPRPLASQDAAYVLSYSVIMLNTDQHNGQVRGGGVVEWNVGFPSLGWRVEC